MQRAALRDSSDTERKVFDSGITPYSTPSKKTTEFLSPFFHAEHFCVPRDLSCLFHLSFLLGNNHDSAHGRAFFCRALYNGPRGGVEILKFRGREKEAEKWGFLNPEKGSGDNFSEWPFSRETCQQYHIFRRGSSQEGNKNIFPVEAKNGTKFGSPFSDSRIYISLPPRFPTKLFQLLSRL